MAENLSQHRTPPPLLQISRSRSRSPSDGGTAAPLVSRSRSRSPSDGGTAAPGERTTRRINRGARTSSVFERLGSEWASTPVRLPTQAQQGETGHTSAFNRLGAEPAYESTPVQPPAQAQQEEVARASAFKRLGSFPVLNWSPEAQASNPRQDPDQGCDYPYPDYASQATPSNSDQDVTDSPSVASPTRTRPTPSAAPDGEPRLTTASPSTASPSGGSTDALNSGQSKRSPATHS